MIALSSGVTLAWWLALAAGLLVAAVVTALLETLRRDVDRLRGGVEDVLTAGGHVAQNTWTIQLLKTTRLHAGNLLAEVRRHGDAERSGR